eukprot:scaffold116783_cov63-Phaeocystis_antarctica.AAC.1
MSAAATLLSAPAPSANCAKARPAATRSSSLNPCGTAGARPPVGSGGGGAGGPPGGSAAISATKSVKLTRRAASSASAPSPPAPACTAPNGSSRSRSSCSRSRSSPSARWTSSAPNTSSRSDARTAPMPEASKSEKAAYSRATQCSCSTGGREGGDGTPPCSPSAAPKASTIPRSTARASTGKETFGCPSSSSNLHHTSALRYCRPKPSATRSMPPVGTLPPPVRRHGS